MHFKMRLKQVELHIDKLPRKAVELKAASCVCNRITLLLYLPISQQQSDFLLLVSLKMAMELIHYDEEILPRRNGSRLH